MLTLLPFIHLLRSLHLWRSAVPLSLAHLPADAAKLVASEDWETMSASLGAKRSEKREGGSPRSKILPIKFS